ncbi:hypothetical protein pipiens_019237 [Culex pipiens pipiens]|uniref:Uncharacterized protein n=1 Tax=Culex pipiens pipiens TaxID=38569 RepID=A0ABD1DXY4_CULPP
MWVTPREEQAESIIQVRHPSDLPVMRAGTVTTPCTTSAQRQRVRVQTLSGSFGLAFDLEGTACHLVDIGQQVLYKKILNTGEF